MYINHVSTVALHNQEKFCAALFALLEKKPLKSITVTELCRAAGVERMTFYRHFECREDIVSYYLDSQMVLLMQRMAPAASLEDNVTQLFLWYKRQVRQVQLLVENHMQARLMQALGGDILRLLFVRKRPAAEESLQENYRCSALVGMFFALCESWCANGFAEPAQNLARYFSGVLRQESLTLSA